MSAPVDAPPPVARVEERPAPLITGVLGAVRALLVVAVAPAGRSWTAAVVLLLQAWLAVEWISLVGAASPLGALLVVLAAAVAADLAVSAPGGPAAAGVAGAVGLGVLVALGHQLARRTDRSALLRSLAAVLTGVVLVVALAQLVVLAAEPVGPAALRTGLLGLGAGLLAGRLVDTVVDRPALAPRTRRGWPGLGVGFAAGAACGAAYGASAGAVGAPRGAVLAGVVALVAALADLAAARGYDERVSSTATRGLRLLIAGAGASLALAAAAPVLHVLALLLLT